MGCSQSKIENEEAVSRCKERKQLMKLAVSSRNAFAAAHSSYAVAIKNTGAALHDYGLGEIHDPHLPQPTTQPPMTLPPPPPPLPSYSQTLPPLQRAATMPELSNLKPDSIPTETIREEDDDDMQEDNDNDTDTDTLVLRRNASGARGSSRATTVEVTPAPPPPELSGMAEYIFAAAENMPGSSLSDTHEIRPHKDEGTSGGFDDRSKKTEEPIGNGDLSTKGSKVEAQTMEKEVEPPLKTVKKVIHSHTASADGKRVGKAASNSGLLQILSDLDDHFLKAYESAHDVSKMLEANRLHYHSNFADNRGHIDHSARVMRVITWNRSFRGMPNFDEGKDDRDAEESETHATVLDKMLAWEKKLYDEVKAGELMKFEYQRKLALLNKQKKHSSNPESLEKTKAAVSHLHTRYIVDMQSMDSTISEITTLRDHHLYPKLVVLVEGMAKMWEIMSMQHKIQLKLVTDIRSLDISRVPKETTEQHHDRTVQIYNIVNEWHSQFHKLMTHQKEYVRALNSWLKLNLIPIESNLKEKVLLSSPPRVEKPPIQALLLNWHDQIEKLPHEVAKSAISSFAAVINTIIVHQFEEMKLKEKYEETSKELSRKTRSFEDWKKKYMERRTPPDEMDSNPDKDPVMEKQIAVEILKKRLQEEVEAHKNLCLQVRDKSLGSLKTCLPELFRSMSEFSFACSKMYRELSSISQSQNTTEEFSS